VETLTPRTLGKVIAAHPQSSVQDALLLLALLLAALMLALQYDLFFFIKELSDAQREISLAEGVLLSLLLTASILIFIVRRLSEQRRDLSLRAAAEMELRELTALALQDPLTGLLNRRAFMDALTEAVKSPPTNGTQHAVFLVDLDHFKRINDVHGHAAGDHVLEVVAERFRAASRPSDVVARIGGDEFAILAYNVDRDAAQTIGDRFLGKPGEPDPWREARPHGKHVHRRGAHPGRRRNGGGDPAPRRSRHVPRKGSAHRTDVLRPGDGREAANRLTQLKSGADGGSRTRTGVAPLRILSPVCLPVPPRPRAMKRAARALSRRLSLTIAP
jgi:GGDEF domain-containing protein